LIVVPHLDLFVLVIGGSLIILMAWEWMKRKVDL
jgi:hypothetical protein